MENLARDLILSSGELEEWRRLRALTLNLSDADLRRHARVSTDNMHVCASCFCCACVAELRARNVGFGEEPIARLRRSERFCQTD